jgi:hypothetical protein
VNSASRWIAKNIAIVAEIVWYAVAVARRIVANTVLLARGTLNVLAVIAVVGRVTIARAPWIARALIIAWSSAVAVNIATMSEPSRFANTNAIRIAFAVRTTRAAVAINAAIIAKVIVVAVTIARRAVASSMRGTIIRTGLQLTELAVESWVTHARAVWVAKTCIRTVGHCIAEDCTVGAKVVEVAITLADLVTSAVTVARGIITIHLALISVPALRAHALAISVAFTMHTARLSSITVFVALRAVIVLVADAVPGLRIARRMRGTSAARLVLATGTKIALVAVARAVRIASASDWTVWNWITVNVAYRSIIIKVADTSTGFRTRTMIRTGLGLAIFVAFSAEIVWRALALGANGVTNPVRSTFFLLAVLIGVSIFVAIFWS